MEDCLFCKIVSGDIPADIVYSDQDILAFRDINPVAPVHVLVIPRRHISDLSHAGEDDSSLIGALALAAARIAAEEGVGSSGYRCVVNTGPDAQQSVHHVHLHVVGGRQMSWPPG